VIAPQDERAGGTWLGYNAAGVLVAITNRWVPGEGDRSRGLLVDDALSAESAREAIEIAETGLQEREYAPFHLLAADRNHCELLTHDPTEDAAHQLDPGVHVIVNVGRDGEWFVPEHRAEAGRAQAKNAERVRETLRPEGDETAIEWTGRAGEILGDHDHGVCIHGNGFGTRSSALIRLGEERVFEFADGPPCETPFRRVEESV
jgi:uncharacterized protein with NRDE domain